MLVSAEKMEEREKKLRVRRNRHKERLRMTALWAA